MSESEFKNCKPQSARPDPYQNEMGDSEVKLEAQAPAQMTSMGLLVCFKTGPCSQNCSTLCSSAQISVEYTEISSKIKCTKIFAQ